MSDLLTKCDDVVKQCSEEVQKKKGAAKAGQTYSVSSHWQWQALITGHGKVVNKSGNCRHTLDYIHSSPWFYLVLDQKANKCTS